MPLPRGDPRVRYVESLVANVQFQLPSDAVPQLFVSPGNTDRKIPQGVPPEAGGSALSIVGETGDIAGPKPYATINFPDRCGKLTFDPLPKELVVEIERLLGEGLLLLRRRDAERLTALALRPEPKPTAPLQCLQSAPLPDAFSAVDWASLRESVAANAEKPPFISRRGFLRIDAVFLKGKNIPSPCALHYAGEHPSTKNSSKGRSQRDPDNGRGLPNTI